MSFLIENGEGRRWLIVACWRCKELFPKVRMEKYYEVQLEDYEAYDPKTKETVWRQREIFKDIYLCQECDGYFLTCYSVNDPPKEEVKEEKEQKENTEQNLFGGDTTESD